MSKASRPVLRAPLKDLLDDELTEARLQRIWRKLEGAPEREPRRFGLRSQLWAAVAVLLVSIAAGSGLYLATGPGALAIRGADALEPQRMLGAAREASYRLTDGSLIRLGGAARIEVLANDGRAFALRLESGRAQFEVKPGGPRRWRVDCGEVSVEVVGTSFAIDRAADGVGVRVEHGVVVVRGVRLVGGERRLTAGQQLYVPQQRRAADAPSARSAKEAREPSAAGVAVGPQLMAASEAAPSQPRVASMAAGMVAARQGAARRSRLAAAEPAERPPQLTAADTAAATSASRRPLLSAAEAQTRHATDGQADRGALSGDVAGPAARPRTPPLAADIEPRERGEAAATPRTTRPAPAGRSPPTAAELGALLRAADRARREGDADEAQAILQRIRSTAPESAHAALAALTLARMRMASEPSLAAADLDAALRGQLPAALREDAMARKVEAHVRAGDAALARGAAEAYARAFPHGRRGADVERWIRAP